jgi:hypothetical protein
VLLYQDKRYTFTYRFKQKQLPGFVVLQRTFFMESVNLVVLKAAEMIAPYKGIENKAVIIAALMDVFIEHGFTVEQSMVLAVKAYNS